MHVDINTHKHKLIIFGQVKTLFLHVLNVDTIKNAQYRKVSLNLQLCIHIHKSSNIHVYTLIHTNTVMFIHTHAYIHFQNEDK